MLSHMPTALCLLLCSAASTIASSVITFSDADCQQSQTRIAGENGYPDGFCTNIADKAGTTYQSFMFTVLDDGCVPTIYLSDTTEDQCSGFPEVGFLSRCYNTSWIYYSIDGCTPLGSGDTSSGASTTLPTSSTAAASDTSSAPAATTSHRVSDGAIAGAVVGSVCGLGIIAAVCVYFFWFRPKQRERKRELKREIEESGMRDAAGAGSAGAGRKEEEDGEAYLINMRESQQQSHEMQAMPDVFEAPGDNRANEMGVDGEVPVELPGDHQYDGQYYQKKPRP
ncbi:hypothetical protein KVR01_009729 [Diaporthe batatas]|uniref:uncharacterized protein n=1 Tax=Diaporthe batatas TaxID=748121 RepID=UPI001D05425E|nr:uncharacterized protein KVR01_009729 [Diaporthe batatas]KAG8160193.1 hypothetical protein KVR01_009729 [Diaporthe batatas]